MEEINQYLDRIAITAVKDVEVDIDYADNDIIILDNIKLVTELSLTKIQMNMLAFCYKGKVQMKMNNEMITLNANQILISPSHTIFSDFMLSPDFEFKVIFISNRMLNQILCEKMNVWTDLVYHLRVNVINIDPQRLKFLLTLADAAKLWINSNEINCFQDEIKQSLLRACILGFCSIVQTYLQDKPIEKISKQSQEVIFHKFLEMLQNNKIKHKTVDFYSNNLFISPKYLSTICKKQSGKTAGEWICEYVLQDIQFYLKQTDYSIKEISITLGFPNSSFFGKYVKKHFNMTPKQLRMEIR